MLKGTKSLARGPPEVQKICFYTIMEVQLPQIAVPVDLLQNVH